MRFSTPPIGLAILLFSFWGCDQKSPAKDCHVSEFGENCTPCACLNGTCDDGVEGTGACACEPGWSGATCDTCDEGYAGPLCDACDVGFYEHPIGSGTCVDDPCDSDPCNDNGSCDNDTGVAVCTCDQGWTGAVCDTCESGRYEYPAGSGACVDDPCDPDPCGGNGACANDTGIALCSCDQGWTGTACDACDVGYAGAQCDACDVGFYEYPAGSGACIDDPCDPDPCSGHGTCDHSGGSGLCECAPGWAGADCDACVRYVNPGASSGSETGLTWSDAFLDIQSAIDSASEAVAATPTIGSCEVWVTQGTYYVYLGSTADHLLLRQNVRLYGGFSGAGTERSLVERDWAAQVTTLDGHNGPGQTAQVAQVVVAESSSTLDGFTVSGGFGGGQGGGLYLFRSTDVVISNTTFLDNEAGTGGAIYAYSSTLSVSGCRFERNSASVNGGAVALTGETMGMSDALISNCFFLENNAAQRGGAIWSGLGRSTIHRSTFSLNVGGLGGALHCQYATVGTVVTDSSFINNRATNGGGVYLLSPPGTPHVFESVLWFGNYAQQNGGGLHDASESSTAVRNCAFTANGAFTGGGGIYNQNATPMVGNSILWGNFAGTVHPEVMNQSASLAVVRYSAVAGGASGSGNISADPLFANAPSFTEHTTGVSSGGGEIVVADASRYAPGVVIEIDLDGIPRTVTGSVGATVQFAPPRGSPAAGSRLVFNWGPGATDLSPDLRLTAGSPCIDAGDGDAAPLLDRAGDSRRDEPSVANTGTGTPDFTDIGAYEF